MSDLLSRLFETKSDWEKTLATETQNRGLGERSKWIESEASLQALIEAADDPVLTKGIVTKKVAESKSKETMRDQSKKLSELRDEMLSSLDELCKENMDTFESKLAFQTQKLQDSIESSAQFVVRTLSGPYDRLLHEVLQRLHCWLCISFTDRVLSGSATIMEGNGELWAALKLSINTSQLIF